MTLLGEVVLHEHGERDIVWPTRGKSPAEYRALYVAKRVNDEDSEILKKYYLCERARMRLRDNARFAPFFKRAREARHALEVLAEYDKVVICVPWKIWWRDKSEPKHPFSILQERVFRVRHSAGAEDITGGLAFWISEAGLAKNRLLHEALDDIVIAYLTETVPMHERIVCGSLTKQTKQKVIEEIERLATEAAGAIVIARSKYSLPADPRDSRPHPVTLGKAEAEQASAEGHARAWLNRFPPHPNHPIKSGDA